MRFKKSLTLKILLIGFVLIALALIGNPFKITDPADPKFDRSKFEFSDYDTRPEMQDAFRKLFPVGTSRKEVEAVLIDAGGGSVTTIAYGKSPAYTEVKYYENLNLRLFMNYDPPTHFAIYDGRNKLINMVIWNREYLYPGQPTRESLDQQKLEKFNHDDK